MTESASQGSPALSEFGAFHYQRINARRLEHLALLRLEYADRTVLECGAGVGDLSSFFLDRGCSRLLAVEGRPDNVEIMRQRYGADPRVRVLKADLESPPQLEQRYDIVFAYGILYHLADPEPFIRWTSEHCAGSLLLSTCISLKTTDEVVAAEENPTNPSQALGGTGSRPTRPWLERQLRSNYPFVYRPVELPAHEQFRLGGAEDDLEQGAMRTLHRAIYVASQEPISNPLLSPLPAGRASEPDSPEVSTTGSGSWM